MSLPSDELHKTAPVTPADFAGVGIHEALIFQKAMRARVNSLSNSPGAKAKNVSEELKAIDLTLSVYIAEEMGKADASGGP